MLYPLLYAVVKLHALLPLPLLYRLADGLYIVVYRLLRYRVGTVRRNLAASFPTMSRAERQQLERRFYRHFTDYIVETVKLAHITPDELMQRARMNNPEIIDPLLAGGHTCFIILMGHYGNWEWLTDAPLFFGTRTDVWQLYRPLTNRAADRLFIRLRSGFGGKPIRKNDAAREILRIRQSQRPALVVFIADQTPSRANLHYWTTFLHQETPVLTGAERLAVKLNLPVIYADVRKTGRGCYTVDFELITDRPRQHPEYWITEQYARRMERTILRDPANWLWTHRRWKHRRQQSSTGKQQSPTY